MQLSIYQSEVAVSLLVTSHSKEKAADEKPSKVAIYAIFIETVQEKA